MKERSNQLLRAISGIGLPPETPGNPFAVLPEDLLTRILLRAGRKAAVGLYLSCAGNAGRLAGMRRLWRELGGTGFSEACGNVTLDDGSSIFSLIPLTLPTFLPPTSPSLQKNAS
jgi:hypothetical protein